MPEQSDQPSWLASSRVLFRLLGVGASLLLVLMLLAGFLPRLEARQQREENRRALSEGATGVVTVAPEPAAAERRLTLPGSLEAFQQIKIKARVDGYVGRWTADLGDSVRQGQLLAVIEAPELQQRQAEARADVAEAEAQVAQAESDVRRVSSERHRLLAEEEQARAEVGQAEADILARRSDAEFARVSNERWQKLVADRAISLQEADQRAHLYQAARANVQSGQERLLATRSQVKAARARQIALAAEIESARARVRSAQAKVEARRAVVDALSTQMQFCQVRAPFTGVITQRYVDVGSLVSAGGDKTTLFDLSQSRRLRVVVDVPQADAGSVRVGQQAQVVLRERPGQPLQGLVTRTAGALDASTRTLRTQIEIDNRGGLEAGTHAEVALTVRGDAQSVLVPASAVVVRADGPKVFVVDPSSAVHLRPVELGHDFGQKVEIARGLSARERVVNFPPDTLAEGQRVELKG